MQVFQLTGHLLYWGRATVIYPVCESNLYVVSQHTPTPLPARLKVSIDQSGPSIQVT